MRAIRALAELEKNYTTLRVTLERIANWPYDVNVSDYEDLYAIKALAALALQNEVVDV